MAVSSPALTQAGLRKVLLMFAVTLGTAGAWILISEFARPSRIGFPVHHNDLDADQRAKTAASAAPAGAAGTAPCRHQGICFNDAKNEGSAS